MLTIKIVEFKIMRNMNACPDISKYLFCSSIATLQDTFLSCKVKVGGGFKPVDAILEPFSTYLILTKHLYRIYKYTFELNISVP